MVAEILFIEYNKNMNPVRKLLLLGEAIVGSQFMERFFVKRANLG